jgi:hypothetical protein
MKLIINAIVTNLQSLFSFGILQDQFIQSWFSDMNKSSRGQFYSLFKNEFKLEPYLLKLSQVNCGMYLHLNRLILILL